MSIQKLTSGREFAEKILAPMGLPLDRLTSAKIIIVPDDVVKIEAVYFVGLDIDGELEEKTRHFKLLESDK